MKKYYVYILANKYKGTLYTGFSSNLPKRTSEHKQKIYSGFTEKYNISLLVYYEVYDDPNSAIHREKRLKKYTRVAKIKLIEKDNPQWRDLFETICA